MRDNLFSSFFSNKLPEKAEESALSNEKPLGQVSNQLEAKIDEYDTYECDYDVNPAPLYVAVQKRDWNATIARVEENPIEARTWVYRKEKDGRMRWRLLPLHSAVIFKAPKNVIEALLSAYPEGTQGKDDQGMLPIHLAFRNGSPDEVVDVLLAAFPQSVDVRDNKGRLPSDFAQTATSTNNESLVTAPQRGPTYEYTAPAAAATERSAVAAEERAILDSKLAEADQSHRQEVSTLTAEYAVSKMDYQRQIKELENELVKAHETSTTLADHIAALEAQLASRGDTERFLATKIAKLESSLEDASSTKESLQLEMKAELERVTAENEGLKTKVASLQSEESEEKEKLGAYENKLSEALEESKKKSTVIKLLQADLIEHRTNIDKLETQTRSKIMVEQTLASQVSTLASQLAVKAADANRADAVHEEQSERFEGERSVLRSTIKDLAEKLANVSRCLDVIQDEQERIVQASTNQEKTMVEVARVHIEILEDARRQKEVHEVAGQERQTISDILGRQKEALISAKEEKEKLTEDVVLLDWQMDGETEGREDISTVVEKQCKEMRDLIDNSLRIVPKGTVEDDDIVEAVLKFFNRSDMIDESMTSEEQVAPEEPITDSLVDTDVEALMSQLKKPTDGKTRTSDSLVDIDVEALMNQLKKPSDKKQNTTEKSTGADELNQLEKLSDEKQKKTEESAGASSSVDIDVDALLNQLKKNAEEKQNISEEPVTDSLVDIDVDALLNQLKNSEDEKQKTTKKSTSAEEHVVKAELEKNTIEPSVAIGDTLVEER